MSTAEQIIATVVNEHTPMHDNGPFGDDPWTGCASKDCADWPGGDDEAFAAHVAAHVVAALTNAGKTIVDDTQDEWQHRNASGGGTVHATRESAELAQAVWELDRDKHGVYGYFEPPMAPSVGIYRRTVTEWEPAAARVAEGGDQP